MLEVKGLYQSLGNKSILQDINFKLKKEGITALLGPNGSGKTTLMRSIIGFYDADAGEITFDNYNLSQNRKEFIKNIAYVPEYGGIYPEMTVYEYIKFMADIKMVSDKDFALRFKELINALELQDVLSQKCETLSKGFSRRTAIAGALITNPKFLILDEPCEGLDVKQKVNLRAFLKQRSKDCSILISTHIMEDVEAMADNILLILNGKLICNSTIDNFKKQGKKISVEDSFFTILQG